MNRIVTHILLWIVIWSLVVMAQPLGAAQPKKLRLAFSAFAYAIPPFWIAHELKLFEKYGGYDTELVYVGGSRPIQAMLGGSTTWEAIYSYQTRPELTVPVVAKYMRVAKDDPAVVEAQRTIGQMLNQNLPPCLDGVRFVLDHYAERQPSLVHKNLADFVDMRFVRKLEEEGFFKKFASK
ncbi:MAG TPA: hypothetical protein VE170_02270 [Candidatus Limnocylindria bacterium]|nr:hypothetical protein [Candidatus Limnocylindria bacterium]